MGVTQSKTSISRHQTQIGLAVAKLKDKRAEHIHSTQCLTLKFPKLKVGLRKAKELFKQFDDSHEGNVNLTEFEQHCPLIGLSKTHPGLREMWRTADMEHDRKLDFPEFVLVLQLVHLLEPEETLQHLSPEIKAALQIMEQAFCYFDSQGDGVISVKEVSEAVKRTSSRRVLQPSAPGESKPSITIPLRRMSLDLLNNVVGSRPNSSAGKPGGSSPRGDFWAKEASLQAASVPAPSPDLHKPSCYSEHKMGHERRIMDPVAVKLFNHLDADHNGKISFGEFIVGLVELVMEDEEEDDDTNGSGDQQ